jgi:hypothetical protein
MFRKSMTALALSLLAVTAAQAGSDSHKSSIGAMHAKIAEAKAKVAQAREHLNQGKTSNIFAEIFGDDEPKKGGPKTPSIFSEIFGDPDKMDKDGLDMDSMFGKLFGAITRSADSAESKSRDGCISAADGKHGANNSGPNTGNGGKGGTVIVNGKKGGCYSANGGNGGSGNWSFGNNRTGNGGNGGKSISR